MKYYGYIAGDSLENIQNQWEQLLDREVTAIIFDEKLRSLDEGKPLGEIGNYVQSMIAGQSVQFSMNQTAGYYTLDDVQQGDVVVITSLTILVHSNDKIWETLYQLHSNGIGLLIVDTGFYSNGEYGDVMMDMMNSLYQLAKHHISTP